MINRQSTRSAFTTVGTMTNSRFGIFKFVKIIICSLFIIALVLFTIASIRTLSLDVNVGLQLAKWEKTKNISLVIDQHQREELLRNFKGIWSRIWAEQLIQLGGS